MNSTKRISPWAWVPTLYFAQGIPYFIVNNISVLMFAKMGVPNGEMALFTSLLYLPWTIKPFWSPFIDIIKTKRWWIVSMQILMSIAFILLTLSIPKPDEAMIAAGTTPISMFTITLFLFIITAFASATHDIAADGFYMLALKQSDQAAFVGIRSTFYRLASIFGQGVLVAIAGAEVQKHPTVVDYHDAGYSRHLQSGDFLSPLCNTQACYRQVRPDTGHSQRKSHIQRIRAHICHLLH